MRVENWGAGYVWVVGIVCLGAVFYLDRPVVQAIVGLLGLSALWFGVSTARGGHRSPESTTEA